MMWTLTRTRILLSTAVVLILAQTATTAGAAPGSADAGATFLLNDVPSTRRLHWMRLANEASVSDVVVEPYCHRGLRHVPAPIAHTRLSERLTDH